MSEDDGVLLAAAEFWIAVVAIIGTVSRALQLDLEAFKDLQPAATVTGLVITVWIAASAPGRTRRAGERVMAIAAARASLDAIGLVAERMRPRLDPELQQAEGRTLRGTRSKTTVAALSEIKLSDIPAELIPHFNRIRSGLAALTESMDIDAWPSPRRPLSELQLRRFRRYGASFEWVIESYEVIRQTLALKYGEELEPWTWRMPTEAELRARDEHRFPGVKPAPISKPRPKKPNGRSALKVALKAV